MGLFDVSLLYVVIRSILAAATMIAISRYSGATLYILAQLLADVLSALMIMAYVDAPLRDKLGAWVILMFLYTACWEGLILVRRLASFTSLGPAETAEEEQSLANPISNTRVLVWTAFAVAPALASGFFLTLNAFAPGNWLFPGQPLSTVTG